MIQINPRAPLFVFGGPYSNLRALAAAFTAARDLGVPKTNIICTGDVVAYAAEPEESVRLIREADITVIAGNCEQQLGEGADDCGCGFEEGTICDRLAKGWYSFANARLSSASRAWMRQLPSSIRFTYSGRTFLVVHGGVKQVNRFIFRSDVAVLAEELTRADADVVIAGHSGIPFVATIGTQLWFNAGVVGMPANDGTPDGWYGLVLPDADEAGLSFALRRLRYRAQAAADALREVDPSSPYADTLVSGRWPSLDVLPPVERSQTGQPIVETIVRYCQSGTRQAARLSA
ncbi:MAG: metallophosphoesterase family protein [Hyphomicrobiaceae bacterium]